MRLRKAETRSIVHMYTLLQRSSGEIVLAAMARACPARPRPPPCGVHFHTPCEMPAARDTNPHRLPAWLPAWPLLLA